jgi:hypothetical protein
LEKIVANDDLSIKNEDLAGKDMEDMVISDNFPKDIMKDYLEVSLYSKVEIL